MKDTYKSLHWMQLSFLKNNRRFKIFPCFTINLMIFIIEQMYLVHGEFQLMATCAMLQCRISDNSSF